MKLRDYLRNEFAIYIRPLFIKSKCEVCGSEESLHLHHIEAFQCLLDETLLYLELKEKDSEEYTERQLKAISDTMLSRQLKTRYLTLCQECHTNEHKRNGGFCKTTGKYKTIQKFKNEFIERYNYNINESIKKYGIDEKYIGIKLTNELKDEMIEKYSLKYIANKPTFKLLKNQLVKWGYIVDVTNGGTYIFKKGEIIKKDSSKSKKEIEAKDKLIKLEKYLMCNMNKKLYKEDREVLISIVDLRDSKCRLQKSISIIDSYCIENTGYTINSRTEQITVDGKRKKITYWVIGVITH